MSEENYLEVNKASWNQRTEHHFKSDFYDVENFLKGKNVLNSIELQLLGDVKGKSILHLQCHFGQDSLCLSQLGAKVTGIDFSDKAIEKAKELNEILKLDAEFICCDIYNLPNLLNQEFDIIFTSYGVIGWLPDLEKWATIINRFLKPGGTFIMAEFHPVVWMFDDDFSKIGYNYFKDDAIIETQPGTYAQTDAPINTQTISWNHSLSEVIGSLIHVGLTLKQFHEFDYSPYNCFRHTIKVAENKYRIQHLGNHIPMVYSLCAIKEN